MSRGKLLVFEGCDAAGKKTQTDLLVSTLGHLGISNTFLSFPDYPSGFGQVIRECLDGKHGDFLGLDPVLSALPYILDRAVASPKILRALRRFRLTVSNRYAESNFAFCAAKVPDNEQIALVERLQHLEYAELGLIPMPDRVIYMSMSLETTNLLLDRRGEERDQYEKDREYQGRVDLMYRRLAVRDPKRWRVIFCDPRGVMRKPEDIHEEVMGHVHELLAD